jgi:hypothetical protein
LAQGLRNPRRLFWTVGVSYAFALVLPYLGGHWRLEDDTVYLCLPTLLLHARTLAEGMWPLWNPNAGFGQPWALTPGSGIFYPPQILWGLLVGWSETKYVGYVLVHLALGTRLAAGFGHRAGLTPAAALFFALSYVGCGYLTGMYSSYSLLIPNLWWPLLGTALIELHDSRSDQRRASWKLAAALFAIESVGYPLTKLIIYSTTAAVAILLTRGRTAWRPIALVTAGVVLLSAPEWYTTLEALPLSGRIAEDIYDDAIYHNVANFLQLATLVLPAQFMERNQFQLGIMHLERSWWLGTLPLALLAIAGSRGLLPLRRYRAPIAVSLVAFLLALGGHSFAREAASWALPLLGHLRQFHLPRIAILALAAFLGALALDALRPSRPGTSPRVSTVWIAFLGLCTVAALSEADHPVHASSMYLDPASGWKMGALHALFYLCLAFTAYRRRELLPSWLGWQAAIVAIHFLCMADMAYAFRHLIAVRSSAPLHPVTDEPFRPASPQPNERSTKRWFDGSDWYTWEGNRKVLNAYIVPLHRRHTEALADPEAARLGSTLASCDGCGHFEITRYFGNVIEVAGEGAAPARLVVHDHFDERWRATVNGAPTPVQVALRFFKAVDVPAGRWTARFEYVHPAMPWLWALSAAGLLWLGLLPRLDQALSSRERSRGSSARRKSPG